MKLDIRDIKFFWQKITRGFSDDVTWSLDYEIAKFTLPRLKLFKEISPLVPTEFSKKEWDHILDELIWYFEIIVDFNIEQQATKRHRDAHELFNQYYRSLWW